jgi:hypothetical protein
MGFDFSKLKLPPTFDRGITTKKLVTTIPVRKPRSGLDFFRIRPEPEWTFQTYLLDLKEGEEEKYLVHPDLIPKLLLTGKLKPVTIYTGITFTGQVLFLSDIPLPDMDGKDNEYNRSRRVAYEIGKTKWIKIQANKPLGSYEIIEAVSELPEPVWPEDPATMDKALEIAFKNNFIETYDHPVLKRLRGEL